MKQLCIVSEESIISGCAVTGVAELADSVGSAFVNDYDVTVVCPDGGGMLVNLSTEVYQYTPKLRKCRIFGMTYFLIHRSIWETEAVRIVDNLHPDIVHSFATPELLTGLTNRPEKIIYTIDNVDMITDPEGLRFYDAVATVSEAYAEELRNKDNALGRVLREIDFRGVTCGVMSNVMTPTTGLLLTAKYSADDQSGKELCKASLCKTYGIAKDAPIFLMMCRLVRAKGVPQVLDCIESFKEVGGHLLIVGYGERAIEQRLRALNEDSDITWVGGNQLLLRALPLLAGADFFLSPSLREPCGLMVMNACHYGAIPITTLAGGLGNNMDEDVALIIRSAYDLPDGIDRAAELYADKNALIAKRRVAMTKDFSWATRKQGYIEMYEAVSA